jgi:hypothetical protein
MINFRYHVVSLIAVFLALAIGVIMGSAVIDRAIVDRLEDQQTGLREDIRDVEETNDQLRAENDELRDAAAQLTEQGSQRLLTGTLTDLPVLVVASRGVEDDSFDAMLSLLATSGADRRGTLWLTDRFELDDEDEQRDLATAIDAPAGMEVDSLRSLALTRLSADLRELVGAPADEETPVDPADPADPIEPEEDVLGALRDAGFLDYDPPEGEADDGAITLPAGTEVVVASGERADVAPEDTAVPLAGLLVDERDGLPVLGVLAAEARATLEEPTHEFVTILRDDDDVASALSTVDNIDDFAGRLAAVLALDDLRDGSIGHYGRGPGAQRLLPAPPESDG